jgi:hypothetical protein
METVDITDIEFEENQGATAKGSDGFFYVIALCGDAVAKRDTREQAKQVLASLEY